MASPIQVILSPESFNDERKRTPGGRNKDFYADRDDAFRRHKQAIQVQLQAISTNLASNPYGKIGYAKLILNPSALAKSHRPTYLFGKSSAVPIIGAGDLGELYIEVSLQTVMQLSKKIAQAEETTVKEVDDRGQEMPKPSRIKSEVGAIQRIEPYTGEDKRNFSVTQGIKWLSDSRTGGAYLIELFEAIPPRQDWDRFPREKVELFNSFSEGLNTFGEDVFPYLFAGSLKIGSLMGLKLGKIQAPESQQRSIAPLSGRRRSENIVLEKDINKHGALINFLDEHPLVKSISLPPIITRTHTAPAAGLANSAPVDLLAAPVVGQSYPQIAIVDGGVSKIIGPWLEESYSFLADADKDMKHATFIAGLLIAGAKLNTASVCSEPDGCKIIDIDLLPKESDGLFLFGNYFPNLGDFFEELNNAVRLVKEQTGVRIFNFSMNFDKPSASEDNHLCTVFLDKIAEENDVIFIISAGNTTLSNTRDEWSYDPAVSLRSLAVAHGDTLKVPAESVRNLSVGALNPPHLTHVASSAPAAYSCRASSIRGRVKPDLAHFGGSFTQDPTGDHGLFSIDDCGVRISGCGTSYAAPLVAKTLAYLEHLIEGDISRETLMALAIHHAQIPSILQQREYKGVINNLIGFGLPLPASQILERDDSSITLVFANRLMPGKEMHFKFSWPPSLVKAQKCFGHARITLVSTPPLDYRYGAEFVRINLEAHLRQEIEPEKYKGRSQPIYLPDTRGFQAYESDRIKYGLKWSPVKVYECNIKRGFGTSTNWSLDVDYLTRAGEVMPQQGVPFTVIMTLSDNDGTAPVFQEMHQFLQAQNIGIADIRNAARVTTRI